MFSAVNGDGTDILLLVMIGKPMMLCCWDTSRYQYEVKQHEKFVYFNQSNAWINDAIFKKWFRNEFVLHVQKRTGDPVILVVDNCGGHDSSMVVGNVSLSSLPPNCTFYFFPSTLRYGVISCYEKEVQEIYDA